MSSKKQSCASHLSGPCLRMCPQLPARPLGLPQQLAAFALRAGWPLCRRQIRQRVAGSPGRSGCPAHPARCPGCPCRLPVRRAWRTFPQPAALVAEPAAASGGVPLPPRSFCLHSGSAPLCATSIATRCRSSSCDALRHATPGAAGHCAASAAHVVPWHAGQTQWRVQSKPSGSMLGTRWWQGIGTACALLPSRAVWPYAQASVRCSAAQRCKKPAHPLKPAGSRRRCPTLQGRQALSAASSCHAISRTRPQ